jgi:mono/diheme cytochrome c family protein
MKQYHIRQRWMGAVLLLLLAACSPQPRQLSDLEQQTAWGQAIYRWECARCHEEDRIAPLFAERLITYRSAQNLYEFNRTYMPLDKPGALPETDYWAVTAYLLEAYGMLHLDEMEELGPDNAEEVIFLP